MKGDENKVIDYLEEKYALHGSRAYDLDVVEVCRELRKLREESRWIPVTERLPEPGVYLTFAQGIGRGYETFDGTSFVTVDRHGPFKVYRSHWRTMPPSPEVK